MSNHHAMHPVQLHDLALIQECTIFIQQHLHSQAPGKRLSWRSHAAMTDLCTEIHHRINDMVARDKALGGWSTEDA